MKILHLSYSNAAGVPSAYSRALGLLGHDSISQTEIASDVGYPCDEVNPNLRANLKWADAIVAYDAPHIVELVRRAGKPWLFYALGTHAYNAWPQILRYTSRVNKAADQLEYCRLGCEWLPKPIWPEEYAPYRNVVKHAKFTVAHAPTDPAKKGTALIERTCKELGIALDLITGVSHEECLRRKAACHVLIDQIIDEHNPNPERVDAFAVNGIEAFAMGIPVMGEVSRENERAHHAYLDIEGGRPYNWTSKMFLADELERMQSSKIRDDYANRGLKHIEKHHNPTRQAEKMLDLLLSEPLPF